jgi:hypothetical protein
MELHLGNLAELRSFVLAASVIALGACSGGATPTAAGGGAGGAPDGTGGGATSGATTGGGSTGGAVPTSALVAQCQALASNFETRCAGDDTRRCTWGAYAKLCANGQAQLLVDSMNCLDSTTCRAFSDANAGNACLATVHRTGESTSARAYVESFCTACSGSNCSTVTGTAEILPYLSDADVTSLASCGGSACTFSTLLTSCASVPGLALFAACKP